MTHSPPSPPPERAVQPAAVQRRRTRGARVTGPLAYTTDAGRQKAVPLGPCLIEQGAGRIAEIIWGSSGQHNAEVPVEALERAEEQGHLLLLD